MLLLYTSEREKVLSKNTIITFLYTKVIHNFLYRPKEENYLGSRHLLL